MRCITRVITSLGEHVKPFASICLRKLAAQVTETCQNPKNPTFSHFLFESVAGVSRLGAGDQNLLVEFESALFPPFQHVLQQDIAEFAPYVFQLLSQMIELRPANVALPAAYIAVFPALLAPALWERQANVVPLVRLLEAYLRKAPEEIATTNHLNGVLGVFQKLVASRAQDHQGFFILNAFVECLPLDAWAGHLPAIWGILFQRLQGSRTVKFTKCLVVFISLLAAKHSPAVVSESMAKVQPGIFEMVMKGVACDAIPTVAGAAEEKVVAVAGARFLSESGSIVADPQAWAKLLAAVVATLEKPDELKEQEALARGERLGLGDEADEMEKSGGYSASYSRLKNAARVETDPCADVPDAKIHLAVKIADAANQTPGGFAGTIARFCPEEVQRALAGYCAAAGVALR
jgi:exportin-2 (importin alpha re-exporter)